MINSPNAALALALSALYRSDEDYKVATASFNKEHPPAPNKLSQKKRRQRARWA